VVAPWACVFGRAVRAVSIGAGVVLACVWVLPVSGAIPPGFREGGTLRVNVSPYRIVSLDPGVDYQVAGWDVLYATCAKLVNYRDRAGVGTGQVVPEVAAGLPAISDGGRRYVFTVRPGFRFNTGEAVTAASFAAAIDRDLAPAMHSPAVAFLRDVAGAGQVLSGSSATASGVRATGDQLTVTLTRPAPDFVTRLAMSFFCAVPQELPAQPQGYRLIPMAGPYYIASAMRGGEIVLKQNPFYGGARPRHLDEIDVSQQTDPVTSMLQIAAGKADYDAGDLLPGLLRDWRAMGKLGTAQLSVHPANELRYLVLNTRRPLFRSARMRQAVNYAVDRSQILVASRLFGKPTDQILPPTMPGYHRLDLYPLAKADLARARRLAGPKKHVANFYIDGTPVEYSIANAVVSQLAKIGITVRIRQFGIQQSSRAVPFDMMLGDWTADYPDPYDFINVLLYGAAADKPGSQNLGGFDSPRFDARMNNAATLTGSARTTAYANLDASLMRTQAPIVPLAIVYQPTLVSHNVRIHCQLFLPQVAGLDLATSCLR
jgi:peptide/nickel transport system substrate-binding protein